MSLFSRNILYKKAVLNEKKSTRVKGIDLLEIFVVVVVMLLFVSLVDNH